jgi:hypothetical protein
MDDDVGMGGDGRASRTVGWIRLVECGECHEFALESCCGCHQWLHPRLQRWLTQGRQPPR